MIVERFIRLGAVQIVVGTGSPLGVTALPQGTIAIQRDAALGTAVLWEKRGPGVGDWAQASGGGGGGVGPAGPPGPAPAGTGYVHVTGGVLDVPSNSIPLGSLPAALITDTELATELADYPDFGIFDDHSARHENGGADEMSVAGLSGLLADPQTPLAHTHDDRYFTETESDARFAAISHTHPQSEVTGLVTALAGKAPTAHTHVLADLPASLITDIELATELADYVDFSTYDAAWAAHIAAADPHPVYQLKAARGAANGYASLDAGTKVPIAQIPTGATGATVPFGNDARFTDARTPTAHAASHKSAGTDAIKLDELAAPTDVATLNATAAAHGLLPKLSGDAAQVLLGTGVFGAVPGGGGGFSWEAVVKQAADVTQALAAFVNTDLVFPFVANSVYLIDLFLMCTSVAATTGYRFAFDVSAVVTTQALVFYHVLATTGTTSGGDSIADAAARGLSSGVPAAGALVFVSGKGILVTGANAGTCRLVFGPEVAASATFKANSVMRVHKAA